MIPHKVYIFFQGIQGDCDYRVSTNDAVYEDSQDYGEEDYLVDPRLVLISSVFSLQSLQDVAKFTCTLHIPGSYNYLSDAYEVFVIGKPTEGGGGGSRKASVFFKNIFGFFISFLL